MRYLMLIIDDDMPKAKGYGSIEEWFPGTFAIHEARTFAVRGHDGKAGQSAVARLTTVRYDIILADYNLMDGDRLGPEYVFDIRNSLEGHVAQEDGGLNKDAYIIGTASGWDEQGQGVLKRMLKRKGLVRGLDGATAESGSVALQLRRELEKFLALREAEPQVKIR